MQGRTTPREALRGGTDGDGTLADLVATSALIIFSELRFALMPLAFASACSSLRLLSSSDLRIQTPSDTTEAMQAQQQQSAG